MAEACGNPLNFHNARKIRDIVVLQVETAAIVNKNSLVGDPHTDVVPPLVFKKKNKDKLKRKHHKHQKSFEDSSDHNNSYLEKIVLKFLYKVMSSQNNVIFD